jgi:pimeloyl-ACP methyl ester carboxylesterase
MTRSDLIVVPGAGHMMPLERRADLRDAVRSFVTALNAVHMG